MAVPRIKAAVVRLRVSGALRNQATAITTQAAAPMIQPSVAREHHAQGEQAADHHADAGGAMSCRAQGVRRLQRDDGGPEEERQKERLRHGGGGEVQQIWVERDKGRGGKGPVDGHEATRKAVQAKVADDVRGHAGERAGEAGLPPIHAPHKRQHKQVRQRQPDAAKLGKAGVARVQDASGNAEVRNGVAVEQEPVVFWRTPGRPAWPG